MEAKRQLSEKALVRLETCVDDVVMDAGCCRHDEDGWQVGNGGATKHSPQSLEMDGTWEVVCSKGSKVMAWGTVSVKELYLDPTGVKYQTRQLSTEGLCAHTYTDRPGWCVYKHWSST